jgi:hypothetical protein
MRRCAVIALAAMVLLAGCDSTPRDPPPDVIKSQRQALDKAKEAEQTVQKPSEQRREETEKPSFGY